MKKMFFLLTIFTVFISCSSKNEKLEYSLENAGVNAIELQKVLTYFSANNGDSLKLKAAIFLIENMPYHFSYYGSKVDSANRLFQLLDRLKIRQSKVDESSKTAIADSLSTVLKGKKLTDIQRSDNKTISAEFLINNIESAYKTWQATSWVSDVSFVQFCNYILPYRIRKEQPEYWRDYLFRQFERNKSSIAGSSDIDTLFNYYKSYYYKIEGSSIEKYYHYDMNYSQLASVLGGECLDRCAYQIYHARAVGIPATFDYLPNWGNRPFALHAMVGNSLHHQQVANLITNENRPIDITNEISNAAPKPVAHQFKKDEMPNGLYVQYIKTIPKVYRSTWAAQQSIVDIYHRVPHDQIVKSLLNMTMVDVSNQYLETTNLTIRLDDKFAGFKLAYLAVFEPKGWCPVAFAEPDTSGYITFKNIGKNILYMPMVSKNNQLIPIDDPIIIGKNGEPEKIVLNRSSRIDMHLIRKFPFFSYTSNHNCWIKGISFEGANCADFSDAVKLHSVDYYPFGMQKADVTISKKFRYIRCRPANGARLNIAEIAYYGEKGSDTILLSGIASADLSDNKMVQKAFDGDMLSFFQSYNRDEALTFDLGEGNNSKIVAIRFAPRSDANFVVPGNNYQLYVWDKKWKLLAEQRAIDYSLLVKNMPSNGLYWLKCIEGGKEERIFTYVKNDQIWW